MPVNYQLYEGTIVFRTTPDSATDEDLRTGIANAEYKVAFEIDAFNTAARTGWSVLIQGTAHYVEPEAARAAVSGGGRRAGTVPAVDSRPGRRPAGQSRQLGSHQQRAGEPVPQRRALALPAV